MKHLSNKQQVLEFFNPVLNGDFLQSPGQQSNNMLNYDEPSTSLNLDCCGDMFDKPAWLDNDGEPTVMSGDVLSVGAYYLNGVPLSSWSAQRGGSITGTIKKNTMQNYYYIDALTKMLFPNGIHAFLNKDQIKNYNISKLTVVKMIPCNTGIGFNMYIKFIIDELEIWGRFEKVGIDIKPLFFSEELNQLDKEGKIKIVGKVWNTIINWFKTKPGIYRCIAKELLVYSELGQLKVIPENSIIEVLSATDDRIKIKYEDINYLVKTPTYYWFNWYTKKI